MAVTVLSFIFVVKDGGRDVINYVISQNKNARIPIFKVIVREKFDFLCLNRLGTRAIKKLYFSFFLKFGRYLKGHF